MNQLAVISEARLREAEVYGDFIELYSLGLGGSPQRGMVFSGQTEEGTTFMECSP